MGNVVQYNSKLVPRGLPDKTYLHRRRQLRVLPCKNDKDYKATSNFSELAIWERHTQKLL